MAEGGQRKIYLDAAQQLSSRSTPLSSLQSSAPISLQYFAFCTLLATFPVSQISFESPANHACVLHLSMQFHGGQFHRLWRFSAAGYPCYSYPLQTSGCPPPSEQFDISRKEDCNAYKEWIVRHT